MSITLADKRKVNAKVLHALHEARDLPFAEKVRVIERTRAEALAEVEAERTKETVRPPAA